MSYACQREAAQLDGLMTRLVVCHALTLVACLAREIYSSKTDLFGQALRIIEIFCIPIYMSVIFASLEWLEVIMVREAALMTEEILKRNLIVQKLPEHQTDEVLTKGYQFLALKCFKSDAVQFGGRVREFLWLEVWVFMFFMLTMLALMIKSRFMPVGVDNSNQFAQEYMSLMAEKITYQIDVKSKSPKEAEDYYIDYERIIQVEGVALKVCFPAADFKKLVKDGMEVDVDKSIEFVNRCVVGRITKAECDDERVEETNSLDIMQNSSIIYHMESVLEMQIAVLIMCFFYSKTWA